MTLSITEFVSRATDVHGLYYNYDKFDYQGWDIKSIIICPIHGEFLQKPRQHIERKSGCKLCGRVRQAISKSISENEFIRRATEIHGQLYNYDDLGYTKISSPITIRCSKHGLFTFEHAYAHTINKNGCPTCAREFHRNTTEDFITKSRELYGDDFSYEKSQYITVDAPILVTCKTHGIQEISPTDHYRVGCWMCKRNRMQDVWLDEIGIPNTKTTRQVRIVVDNKLHVVDGYCAETNTVYLFHGDYWHGNPTLYGATDINKRNGKHFGQLYQDTLDYEQRLSLAGYNLVSIWEYEWLQSTKYV